MKHIFVRLSTMLVLLAAFGLIVADAQGATKITGTLHAADWKAGSLTLKSNGILTTIPYSTVTKFSRNKVSVATGSLVLGDKVTVNYRTDPYPRRIKASGPKVSVVSGKVEAFTTSSVRVGGQWLTASAQTLVSRNGAPSSVDNLSIDDSVVSHVSGSGEVEDIQGDGTEDDELYATITAVDTVASTITIQDAAGNVLTLTVTDQTWIENDDDMAITLADLVAGMIVEVHYDPVTFIALRIEVEDLEDDAEIEGVITAVDTVNGTVTIQDASGNSITLIVTGDTEIERDDMPVFLGDLLPGDPVEAEYNLDTMIADEIEVETEVEDEFEEESD